MQPLYHHHQLADSQIVWRPVLLSYVFLLLLFSLSVICFLVCLILFNSSSLPIFSSYYSRLTLILCLFTHSLSSATRYLCLLYFTFPLLHCSLLPLLSFLHSALFSCSSFISSAHFCALFYFVFFHPPNHLLALPLLGLCISLQSISHCLLSFLIVCHSL